MKLSNKVSVLLLFGVLVLLFAGGARAERVANSVVAKVNADLILQSDIDHYVRRYKRNHGNTDAPMTEVLENIFDAQLLRQMAAQRGYIPTDSEISDHLESEISKFKQRFGSADRFKKALSEAGYTEKKLRADMKKEILADLQIQRAVQTRFHLTEAESAKWKEEQSKPDQLQALHLCRISVLFDDDAGITQNEAQAKLEKIMAEIKADGLDFIDGIRKHVSEEDVKSGEVLIDDLGPKKVGDLADNVVAACAGKDARTWTDLVTTGKSISAFYILEKREARDAYFEKKYMDARENLLVELRRKARIQVYSAKYQKSIPVSYKNVICSNATVNTGK